MAHSIREIAVVLIGVLFASCSRPEGAEKSYRHAWGTYLSGNLPLAVEEASRNADRWRKDPNSAWYWSFRLLQAEALTAQSRTREASALLSQPVPSRPEWSQLEVRRLIDQAKLVRGDRASEILERARAAVKDPELLIRLNLEAGIVAFRQDRIDDAEAAFRRALEGAVRRPDLYGQAQAMSNLSYAAKRRRRYEDAVDLALDALAAADKAGARRVAALAHINLGSAYSFLGELGSALEHEEKAAQILKEIGDRANLMIALGEIGVIYDSQGEPRKAIPNYEAAYQIARDLGNSEADAGRHATNLSLAYIQTGQWDLAAVWNQRAFELAAASGAKGDIPDLMRNQARIAFGRGHPDEAIAICEDLLRSKQALPSVRWAAYALMAEIDSEATRFPKALGEFESARNIIEGTRSELLSPRYRITLLSRLIAFYRGYVGALVDRNNDAEALRVVESSRARVLAERLRSDLRPEPFPGLPRIQRLCRLTHSSFLSFWLAPARSFAWLITAKETRRFQLPPAGEIEKLVTMYRDVIEGSIKDPAADGNPVGARLWDSLMAGIAPHIPADSRLIVIPDGALHRLNLETLVAPGPQPHYWIEDVEIAVAPSITIALSKARSQERRPASLLLIGAPDYSGTRYEPLAGAANEVREIQARFAGVSEAVYTGPQASPAAYRQAEPSRFSLIHFAAHAEANADNPLESAVILSHQGQEYKLYARDVIDIPIQADLVTLSGCRSAGARAYAGEGLIGFAWAFLEAGARAVVAGLWDVSDDFTRNLMNRFYAGIASGQDPVHAMRQAKLRLLDSSPQYRKPYYWAPFEVYIGSAAR